MNIHEAKTAGVETYSNGKPCRRGHEPRRFTKNGQCVGCAHVKTGGPRKAYAIKPAARARAAALAAGEAHYTSAKPCRRGHEPLRFAKDGHCVGCASVKTKSPPQPDPSPLEHARLQGFKTYTSKTPCSHGHGLERYVEQKRCVECHAIRKSKRAKTVWEAYSSARRIRLHYEHQPKALARANRQKYYNARYRAQKLNATPPWADLAAIKSIYKNCPAGYHVDHVIPLRGVNVCGLHIAENLAYLDAVENLLKSNKF